MRYFVILVFLFACGKGEREQAGGDLKTAAAAVHASTKRMMTEYPALETQLAPLRTAKPAEAAALIRAKVLPLFADVAKALEDGSAAEKKFVAASGNATGAEAKAVEAIAKNGETHGTQAAAYREVGATYEREAKLLDAGPIADADRRALNAERLAALGKLSAR